MLLRSVIIKGMSGMDAFTVIELIRLLDSWRGPQPVLSHSCISQGKRYGSFLSPNHLVVIHH